METGSELLDHCPSKVQRKLGLGVRLIVVVLSKKNAAEIHGCEIDG